MMLIVITGPSAGHPYDTATSVGCDVGLPPARSVPASAFEATP